MCFVCCCSKYYKFAPVVIVQVVIIILKKFTESSICLINQFFLSYKTHFQCWLVCKAPFHLKKKIQNNISIIVFYTINWHEHFKHLVCSTSNVNDRFTFKFCSHFIGSKLFWNHWNTSKFVAIDAYWMCIGTWCRDTSYREDFYIYIMAVSLWINPYSSRSQLHKS